MRKIPLLPTQQRGAVLYVALVFLVLLALLGVAGMQVSMLQERMAANYRATNVAFQLAESVARALETEIESEFKNGEVYISYEEKIGKKCDPAFDPVSWSQNQAVKDAPIKEEWSRRIDYCTPGFSLAQGVRPESEKSDQMYQVTAFSPDDTDNPTSDAAIDTIFIP